MASGRMLKNSISLNERVNELSIPAMLIYTWMISHADDFGRMRGTAKHIRAAVVPMRDDLTADLVEGCLCEMSAKGLIQRYEVKGEIYIQFPSWDEHQTGLHKRTKSKFPDPIPGDSGKFREIPASCAHAEQNRTEQEQNRTGTEREGGKPLVTSGKAADDKPKTKKSKTEPEATPAVLEVLDYLNLKTGHKYGPAEAAVKLITDRFAEGYSLEDLKAVVNLKTLHWINDSKMAQYLRPSTLFNAEKFAGYIGQARGSPGEQNERYQAWLRGEIDSLDDFGEHENVIEGEVIREFH